VHLPIKGKQRIGEMNQNERREVRRPRGRGEKDWETTRKITPHNEKIDERRIRIKGEIKRKSRIILGKSWRSCACNSRTTKGSPHKRWILPSMPVSPMTIIPWLPHGRPHFIKFAR
jgi:hypothetical protein